MKFDNSPISELTDAELKAIYGGVDGWGGLFGTSASAASSETRVHSFSLTCDINIFSLKVNVIAIDQVLGILSPHTQVCLNDN